MHEAQLVEGIGLAGPVTEVAEQRHGPSQAGRGGRVFPSQLLHTAQFAQRLGLAEPVSGLARRRQGAVVEGGGLIPVTAGGQEAAHRGGYLDGMPEASVSGAVVRGGVQVRPLGFQPGGRLPEGGQVRALRRRAARRSAVAAGPAGEVPPGRHGGVQVVIQQPPGRGVRFGGTVRGGEGARVFAEQVMQLVAAGRRLGEKVLVI